MAQPRPTTWPPLGQGPVAKSTSPPAPVGFPGCRHCPYRREPAAPVCLKCFCGSRPAPAAPRGSLCAVCGRSGREGQHCANPWCSRADRVWTAVYAVGVHEAGLRRAVVAYKYRGERWWAPVFARLLAGYLSAHPTWFEEYDRITPLPGYLGPGARRDWDPTGLIFEELKALLGAQWECAAGLVAKRAETPAMKGRTRPQRVALAEGALRAALVVPDPLRVVGGRILVIDDVLTEGSSLREVATALLAAGAEEVAGLVLARGSPAISLPGPG